MGYKTPYVYAKRQQGLSRRRPPSSGHFAAAEQEAKKAGKQLSAWLTDGKIVDFNGTGIR
jgi:hypothetical protein